MRTSLKRDLCRKLDLTFEIVLSFLDGREMPTEAQKRRENSNDEAQTRRPSPGGPARAAGLRRQGKYDRGRSKRARGAPNTTPADPKVILSTLWDVKRSTAQRKKPHALWYYLFRLRREGTASPGGAARDSRRGLTLDGAMACDKQTGPARPWQTGRSLSNDGNARSLSLGFRV